MRVLITRPQQDGALTAALLAARGHEAILAPLLEPRFHDGPPLDLSGIAAILATSVNGVRALVRRLDRRDIPVFAVGPQTAREARDAGFLRVEDADGDAAALANAVPGWMTADEGALLHARGEHSEGTLGGRLEAKGFRVRGEILYIVEPRPLPHAAVAALLAGAVDAALFFSPRSARIFMEQTGGLPLGGVAAFCISAATAKVLPPGRFGAVHIAAKPNQDALLALLP